MKPVPSSLGLYLIASGLLLAAVASPPAAYAKRFGVLYNFCSQQNCADGSHPQGGVISDETGDLFGTTQAGGAASCSCGTVFKLTSDGTETVLHSFSSDLDGDTPYDRLIADSNGNLYGTTRYGGSDGCRGEGRGCGTVFRVAGDGTESVLYAFGGNADGSQPVAGVITDKTGVIYGTTLYGGGGRCASIVDGGCGAVFRLAPDGTETLLYAFNGFFDGAYPQSALIIDKKGNLYGTTNGGGNAFCHGKYGCGSVFRVAPDGKETLLYSFRAGNDGSEPAAGLIEDKSGNLYGTTQLGGGTGCSFQHGCGTVFKLAADGTETVLHAFTDGSDGAYPMASLIVDRRGNLYGTTQKGGSTTSCIPVGCGIVFKISPDGEETILYALTGQSGAPVANLLAGRDGTLIGTTEFGPNGTVFKLKK